MEGSASGLCLQQSGGRIRRIIRGGSIYRNPKEVARENIVRYHDYSAIYSLASPMGSMPPNFLSTADQLSTLASLVEDTRTAIAAWGFRIQAPQSPHYPGEVRVYGPHRARDVLGVDRTLSHINVDNLPAHLVDVGPATAKAFGDVVTPLDLALTNGANLWDYSVGSHADEGVVSTGFVAATIVDNGTGLGLPTALAAGGFMALGPPGAAIGLAAGEAFDLGFGFSPYRDRTVEWLAEELRRIAR